MSIQIADDCLDLVGRVATADEISSRLVVERLQTRGEMLDRSYELFERVFDPAVLDSKETYSQRMSAAGRKLRDFHPCYTSAYFDVDDTRLIAGFLSSDVMWVDGRADDAFLAVGNIATSPLLKERGVRGVGGELLESAIEIAKVEAARDSHSLICVATEAEPASLGFWRKQGFLWPVGCQYLQPPLDFLEDGKPRFQEVPETLLLAPLEMDSRSVDPELVRGIILSIYENWCLRGWRGELSDAAMRRAEEYVMGFVFRRVASTLPTTTMPLSADFGPAT